VRGCVWGVCVGGVCRCVCVGVGVCVQNYACMYGSGHYLHT